MIEVADYVSCMPAKRRAGKQATASTTAAGDGSVRDHILDRTIYLVGKKGTTDVTVREIAREAGVNVAAVNYYFSSKEQMFAQLAQRFLTGFGEVMALLEVPDMSAEQRLRLWADEVMRNLANYPGILAIMERSVTTKPDDPFGAAMRTAMQRAMRRLKATLAELIEDRDEARLAFKLTLLTSTMAGPFPSHVGPGSHRQSLRKPTARARFLDLLLEHLRR